MKNSFLIKILSTIIVLTVMLSGFIFAKTTYYWEMGPEYNEDNYSNNKNYEYVNEGMSVNIVRTDLYPDNQDERLQISLTIQNNNLYSKASIKVEAIDHEDFIISGEKERKVELNKKEKSEINFDYKYKNSQGISRDKYKDVNILNIRLSNGNEEDKRISTNSEIINKGTKNNIDYNTFSKDDSNLVTKKEPSINQILIIVLIIIITMLIIVVFIYKYIRQNKDFFALFIFIIVSLVINNCVAMANNLQFFNYNIEYSHEYECVAYHVGIPYTFRFKVSYVYNDDIPEYSRDIDSDNDGINDMSEVFYMTDIYNYDTDGDGLPDGVEIYYIDLDPLKVDTDDNGTPDGNEDYDNDKLINVEEINNKTSLINIDTDYDKLTDYEEVKIYGTNPLLKDTDGDGVTDYEEVIIAKKLGIEDFSSIDTNTVFEQKLSTDSMDEKFFKDSVYDIEVLANAYGLIDQHVKLEKKENIIVTNINNILGYPIYVNSDYDNIPLTIVFDLSNYSDRIEGFKIATIEGGKIKFLNTGIEDNKISATINKGYIFVFDGINFIGNIINFNEDNYK